MHGWRSSTRDVAPGAAGGPVRRARHRVSRSPARRRRVARARRAARPGCRTERTSPRCRRWLPVPQEAGRRDPRAAPRRRTRPRRSDHVVPGWRIGRLELKDRREADRACVRALTEPAERRQRRGGVRRRMERPSSGWDCCGRPRAPAPDLPDRDLREGLRRLAAGDAGSRAHQLRTGVRERSDDALDAAVRDGLDARRGAAIRRARGAGAARRDVAARPDDAERAPGAGFVFRSRMRRRGRGAARPRRFVSIPRTSVPTCSWPKLLEESGTRLPRPARYSTETIRAVPASGQRITASACCGRPRAAAGGARSLDRAARASDRW